MPGLHLIALDKSGSMRQGRKLARDDVYPAGLSEQDTRADGLVALLCFCCQGVELLLSPGQARAAGSARVRPVCGGGTPLSVCLQQADRILLTITLQRVPDQDTCLWLFTDDYTFEQLGPAQAAGHIIVIDFDDPLRPIGRCAAWAERWHEEHCFPD